MVLAVNKYFKAREDEQHRFSAYQNLGIQPAATLMNDPDRCRELHRWLFAQEKQASSDYCEQSSAAAGL